MNCGWHVEAPSGLLVRFIVSSYLIESTPDCSKESLTFYDGADSSGKVLFQLCKTRSRGFSIYSSRNVIFVQLKTAIGSSGTKLRIRYKAVAQSVDPGKENVMYTGSYLTPQEFFTYLKIWSFPVNLL